MSPLFVNIPSKVDLATLAGRMASLVRRHPDEDRPIFIKATGTGAVNTAVKSISIARRYVSEHPGLGLGFRVNHEVDSDKDRISRLQFLLSMTNPLPRDEPLNGILVEEMWIRSNANVRTTGGRFAVALMNAERALAIAIGPRCVGATVVGLTWARRILRHNQYDAVAIPVMESVSLRNHYRNLNAVKFLLVRTDLINTKGLDPTEDFNDENKTLLMDEPL